MFKWFKTKKVQPVPTSSLMPFPPGAITYSTNTHTHPPNGQLQQQAHRQMIQQAQGNIYPQQSLQPGQQNIYGTSLGYTGSSSMIFGTQYISYDDYTPQQWEQLLEPLNTYKRAIKLNECHATNEQFEQWEEFFKKKKHHEQFNDDLNEILNEPE